MLDQYFKNMCLGSILLHICSELYRGDYKVFVMKKFLVPWGENYRVRNIRNFDVTSCEWLFFILFLHWTNQWLFVQLLWLACRGSDTMQACLRHNICESYTLSHPSHWPNLIWWLGRVHNSWHLRGKSSTNNCKYGPRCGSGYPGCLRSGILRAHALRSGRQEMSEAKQVNAKHVALGTSLGTRGESTLWHGARQEQSLSSNDRGWGPETQVPSWKLVPQTWA